MLEKFSWVWCIISYHISKQRLFRGTLITLEIHLLWFALFKTNVVLGLPKWYVQNFCTAILSKSHLQLLLLILISVKRLIHHLHTMIWHRHNICRIGVSIATVSHRLNGLCCTWRANCAMYLSRFYNELT